MKKKNEQHNEMYGIKYHLNYNNIVHLTIVEWNYHMQ